MTFDAQLKSTLQGIHQRPTEVEALAIIDVARLAAAADRRSDVAETAVLLSVTKIVCEMAGLDDIPQLAPHITPARVGEIGEELVPQGARELAFAAAFLVMIQDLELTSEEKNLASALGEALVIEAPRAAELAQAMEALVRAAKA